MACHALGMMVPILCISLYFGDTYCTASPSYHRTNVEGVYEQSFLSKNKAGKHHSPPSAHLTHPPPPTALPKSPPIRPGQAPLSVVESEAAFTLYYGRNFKVVQNFFYNFTYLLLEQVGDSNGKDWNLNISVFQDPLMNFSIDTSSAVGFLELLGCVNKLRGVPASFGLASPCILQLISQGEIPIIELDRNLTDPNAVNSNISFEALFGSSDKYINVQLIDEQNQSNYISFDSFMDRGPLQRAEWIKFLAPFFNMEERANTVFGQIYSNYQCLNASSKGGNTSKPLVAWLSYNVDLRVWTFSDDSYKLQLNLDAGGLNLDLSTLSMTFNMSIQSNIDNFYNIASTLDVVIDETYAPDPSAYTWSNLTTSANISDVNTFPFLANKRLWRSDKRIGINNALDWVEGAIAQPQIVLRDLIQVLYPPSSSDDHQKVHNITYFRNIAMEESFVNTTTLPCPYADMTFVLQPTIIPCTIDSVF